MKKETKKLIESICMGIFLVIGLTIFGFSGYFDTKFKITKENYWNESNYQDLINSNCLINSSLKGDYVEFKVICPQCYGGDCDYEIKTHQVCELVEVNDLVIYDNCDLVNYENCLLLGIKDTAECLDLCYINWTDTAQNWLYTNISKEDLTIEFLEEKCECISYGGFASFHWVCENTEADFVVTNEKIIPKGYNNCYFTHIEGNMEKCLKYKCEDYFVEVIK